MHIENVEIRHAERVYRVAFYGARCIGIFRRPAPPRREVALKIEGPTGRAVLAQARRELSGRRL